MPDKTKSLLELFEKQMVEFFAIIIMALLVALRKIPKMVMARTEKKLIIRDLERHAKAFSMTQDLVDEVGATYGWAVFYHNHGPEKFTVMYECLGHVCGSCISKCKYGKNMKRVQRFWIDRPIHKFWLENLALRTLKMDGRVNTVHYDECDDYQKEIFDNLGLGSVKEAFIKTKNRSEFITICLGFCQRFDHVKSVDIKLIDAVNALNRYL